MLRIPGSLHALLANLIDYAGLYPPASLPLSVVSERYESLLTSPDNWILNRLVLPAPTWNQAPIGDGWHVTLLTEGEPGLLPPQIETLETKGSHRLSLPTYCEAPLERIRGAFAKIRTGGLTPDAIPSSNALADFLCAAAARRFPFKATAGLHHPLRSTHRLTDDVDSPRALMHGFLNVFIAAAFAWHGLERSQVPEILDETSLDAFEFHDNQLRWRGRQLTTGEVIIARRDFAHSFGSCSFDEPVSDLRDLGLLS